MASALRVLWAWVSPPTRPLRGSGRRTRFGPLNLDSLASRLLPASPRPERRLPWQIRPGSENIQKMTHYRRTFLFMSGGATFAQAPPSDRIRLGVIGTGGRGTFVMTIFQK